MATITPVPEGVKVPTDRESADFASAMKVAMRSRKGRVSPMTARSAAIFQQLGTDPRERTFLPDGWPKDATSVAVLGELRRTDANWTWDKGTKYLWVDGWTGPIFSYAAEHGITAGKAPAKPRAPKVAAPKVVGKMVATVVIDPAPTCSRCSRPSELPTCQTCSDSLADDIARRPVSLGGDGSPLAEYLGRLVHEPKRLYALELVAHLTEGAPVPVSDAAWAPKVDAKVRRYLKAAA
jgi:hypothetical protein